MFIKTALLSLSTILILAFSNEKDIIEFNYPKNKEAKFTMPSELFKKFKSEWRGKDYYYISENGENEIVCSVLFYKLNKDEQRLIVKPFIAIASGGIPLVYFSNNSNLKQYEKNNTKWGEINDDFTFRQNDILEFEGVKTKQKHMYAYAMFGKDLFVNIHLSKTNYTSNDSTSMRQVLDGLKKVK